MHGALTRVADTSTTPVPVPLSVAQTEIWRAQKLAPDDPLYNIGGYVELPGPVDVDILYAAIRQALADSDSYHFRFIETADGPRQVYVPVDPIEMAFVDFSGSPDARARAMDWMRAAIAKPFDCSAEPLFRLSILKVARDSLLWCGVIHHLVTDLFGIAAFVRRALDVYNARINAQVVPVAGLTPWSDILREEAVYRSSTQHGRDRAYWHDRLRNRPPPLTLSGKSSSWSTGTLTDRGVIPRSTIAGLETLGGARKAGLVAALFSAVAVYLSRVTGHHDLLLGMPLAGRTDAKLRRATGLMSNVVPLRLTVDPAASCNELIQQAGLRIREAFRHQRYWSGALRADLGLAPDEPGLFGLALNLLPSDFDLNFAGVPVRLNPFAHTGRVGDLSIVIIPRNDDSDVEVHFHANEAHYDERSLKQHLDHFLVLLDTIVKEPQRPVRLLPLLNALEWRTIFGWGSGNGACPGGGVESSSSRTLPELFELQVERDAHAVAVVHGQRSLSYAELNARANRLAHRLITEGVGPERVVGLWADRSVEMLIGLLGILKAGGSYLPLDPAYPAERLRLVLEDARPLLLLGSKAVAPPELGSGLTQLGIAAAAEDSGRSSANPSQAQRREVLRAGHAAYVIYTSGSTGSPKGVVVTHAGLSALAATQVARLQINRRSRVLQFASLSFDASVWEVLVALSSGAVLVLAPEQSLSGAALQELLVKQRISHTLLTPTVLATLTKSRELVLECLVVGGEACPPALIAQWSDGLRIVNAYGPTESTVCATMSAPLEAGGEVPIGTPIEGTRVYVLDAALEPVPVGVAGELYIAGVGLARGYLGQPTVTAERFVADPYGEPGSRMYRTGDLARWRSDGVLEYLGRADQQVKLRGHRIELGEIEAALCAQESIAQAAVTVLEDDGSGKYLVAYVVVRAGYSLDVALLRRSLAERLPRYMVPAQIIALEALPLTRSGKLDRKALPTPQRSAASDTDYEPPIGAVETTLAAIWSELLHLERVGRHDNFFASGGNSLLLIELVDRLARQGWRVEPEVLFNESTIAALALAIEARSDARPRGLHSRTPANGIAPDCVRITPDMLPLVSLDQPQVNAIAARVPGGAANIQDIYPLAPLQEGILVHHRSCAGDAYVLRALLALQDPEQVDRFVGALQGAIDRHDALRTAVLWEDLPEPVQVVWRRARLIVEYLPSGTAPAFEALWNCNRERIDVTRAPMLRVHVMHQPEQGRWLLLLRCHHLILDHSSLELLLSEVRADLLGNVQRLPPAMAFRDYVAEARRENASVGQDALFREMLGGLEEPTAPFGMLDASSDGSGIEEARLVLDSSLVSRVRAQARQHNVSASSLFHLAWAMVLARCCGRDDVIFGTVLFGRMHAGVDAHRAFGLYINTLPLRLSLASQTVVAVLRETHERLGQLLRHECASLLSIRRFSSLAHGTPLFSSLFNYRHGVGRVSMSEGTELLPGVQLVRAEERTNYPITVCVDDLGERFEIEALTDRRIDPRRLAEYLCTAVNELVVALESAPQTPARLVCVLPEAERYELLERFNATQATYPQGMRIQGLFTAQASQSPLAVAVIDGESRLTYAEIDRRAELLARQLRQLGVRANHVVGVCLERRAQMIVGLLGILKAGAAYLPLDPGYPAERLQYMLEDAAPALVLTQETLRAVLPSTAAQVVSIDTLLEAPAMSVGESEPLQVSETAESLVYLIYTSGSTGHPKGTAMSHGAMVNLIEWHRQVFGPGAGKKVLQFAALSFDVAFQEIFSTLCTGATLVLIDDWTRRDAAALTQFIRAHQIERLFVPPLMLQTLADYSKTTGEFPGSLRDIITAGEQLRIGAEIRTLFENLAGCRLHNHYGPTETHVVTALTLESNPREWPTLPSIGRPIANTQLYVLDERGRLAPLGVAGEIYIGGAGLAQGYRGRPELTRERFVENPFKSEPGARLYRTGDLARWQRDGTLEFLGRNDDQVKIRGFRVELGEIEAHLASHPQVKEAAAVVREEAGSGKYLVAYVVGRAGHTADVAQLRRLLSERLPPHMTPSQIIVLEALPLTPSGKLDRRALPAPAPGNHSDTPHNPPQTPTEARLAAIWCELLRVERVSRLDDFFAVGGHSLLALQVVVRVRDVFRLELPLKTVFDAPTLESLAVNIDAALGEGAVGSLPPILPVKSTGPAPLSYSQERMWLIQSLNPTNTAYNMGGAVWLRGALDVDALAWSIDALFVRHEILRSRIRLIDDRPHQVVAPWTGGALDVVDLRAEQDAHAAALYRVESELRATFDLGNEPVARMRLFQTAQDSFLFCLVLHHIAGDQWSMGVFGRELALLYNQRRRGMDARLEPLPLTYRDYAYWQRSEAFTARLEQQLWFWTRQLRDLPAVELPVDFPRPKVWTMNGSFYQRKIPAALLEKLGKLAQRAGSTVFMTLFTGFATLLHRRSGQTDIAIGVPVANRAHVALEGLIGTFVNTLVLRTDLSGDPGFGELLRRVRVTALDAFANQDVSFDRLVQEIGQRGDLSRAPLVQVLFNVTNAPMYGIDLEGVAWKPVGLDRGGAQFELSFTVDTEVTHELSVEYNTDLFQPATIERLVGEYFTLLEAAAAAPAERIGGLGLLPPEQWAALRSWNHTRVLVPAETSFPQLFAARAAQCPADVAIAFEGNTLSYGELDARANDLARTLKAAGVTRGARVAICVRRSPWLLVSLLAAQKSAGAYVPLDPEFPAERLKFMLEDCGAKVLVTAGEIPQGLEVPEGIEVVDVSAQAFAGCTAPAHSEGDLPESPYPQDIAYVLYTSGSTGRPKGVTVSHGALVNFLCSMRERPGLAANDVLAAVTTISFDIAGLELYLPLLVGARIELVSRAVATDGAALARLLDASGVTVLQATPATWRLLLEANWRGNKRLRALCGGEALPRKLADEILERVGELWNLYGPTETTIWSTIECVERNGAISIGRPIANTEVHILDRGGALAPIGVAGEICIGGAGVAEGYLRRPDLTAERFIADAYGDSPGRRLYKTGDLGRWGADGKLYHLGRSDHQVKVRGFRIELAEIEATLGSHSSVQQAVAVVRMVRADDPRLVAYVVYRDGEDVTVSDMKRFLRGQLPDYMIPAMVVPVMAMPLTPNGKIDRAVLPDPFATPLRNAAVHNAPATRLEQALADIWRSVLKVETVDALDNFFELGGYSLLSLQVARLLEKRTGHRLDPRMLFFHNLRELAGVLEPAGVVAHAKTR